MALKLLLDSLDGVPEAQQALYTKSDDGKFKLDVDGIPPPEDTKGLKTALERERDAVKDLKAKLKDFDGLNAKEIRDMLGKLDGDEETRLVREGKVEEVVNRRTERQRAEYERKLKAEADRAAAAEERASKRDRKVLEGAIRQAATKAGMHAEAYDDAVLLGLHQFELNDDGDAIAKEGKFGKDGKKPLTPEEWASGLVSAKPHWFPPTGSGSGSQQRSGGGGSRAKQIKRSEFDALPPHEKVATLKAGIVPVD